jgi:leader peptidase (prepilin peptidase)/N-methyltransferase
MIPEMKWWLSLFCGGLGALIGSFLNVCISRLPADERISVPRSHCPRCGKGIAWYDNIPVLSFCILGGRCRGCRIPISWRYPLVETITALLFWAGADRWGDSWMTVKWCILSAVMVELIFSDLETRILPDEFTFWGAAAGVMLSPLAILPTGLIPLVLLGEAGTPAASTINSVSGALVLYLGFHAIAVLYQRLRGLDGLGFGDVKMAATMGAFLGLEAAISAVLLASVSGAILGGAWILIRRRKASEEELPFGSFLGTASLIAGWFN